MWLDDAACRDIPVDVFFPDDTRLPHNRVDGRDLYNRARAICDRCEVRTECLADSFEQPERYQEHGMWGGLTPTERERFKTSAQSRAGGSSPYRSRSFGLGVEKADDLGGSPRPSVTPKGVGRGFPQQREGAA